MSKRQRPAAALALVAGATVVAVIAHRPRSAESTPSSHRNIPVTALSERDGFAAHRDTMSAGISVQTRGGGADLRETSPPLSRQYVEGERLAYRMTASNRGRTQTTAYEATARGAVRRDTKGIFYEEYEWDDLLWNGAAVSLPEASRNFRQLLSLAPGFASVLPDFSKIDLRLVGPTSDFMTFYADVSLAMRQPGLRRAGDETRVNHGAPNSWADGTSVVVGEDSIDFVISLGESSSDRGTRDLLVRHVVPDHPQITIPAEWMRTPVADTPNNWIEVERLGNGRYLASIGKETFDARIVVQAATGKIVSAALDNPVEVFERECRDGALVQCDDGVRYQILRRIQIAELDDGGSAVRGRNLE